MVDLVVLGLAAVREHRDVVLLSGGDGLRLMGFDPVCVFRAKGAFCELRYDNVKQRMFGNPWNVFETHFGQFELPVEEGVFGVPIGVAAGYFGYDLKNAVEPGLPQTARDDLELPDMVVGFYPSLIVEKTFSDGTRQQYMVNTGHDAQGNMSDELLNKRRERMSNFIDRFPSDSGLDESEETELISGIHIGAMSSSVTREQFIQTVNQALEWIRLGHIYQVNLSQRLSVPSRGLEGSELSWRLYQMMASESGAEFSGYAGFSQAGVNLISTSPELFLKMDGSRVQTSPIKGTRPRGADQRSDKHMIDELCRCKKERAELTMITDLLRNDLGRIAKYGSVDVSEFLALKSLKHVHHLYSTIQAEIRDGLTHLEVLKRCFPGGSVTGAPKIRAMEIIDALEPVSRGPYTGSLGFLGFNRVSCLNIMIRTAMVVGDRIHYSAGAGIVSDSDPVREYEETWHKARGFCDILKRLSGGE